MWNNKRAPQSGYPNKNFPSLSRTPGGYGSLRNNSPMVGDIRLGAQSGISLPSSVWESTDSLASLIAPSPASTGMLKDPWVNYEPGLGNMPAMSARASSQLQWSSQKGGMSALGASPTETLMVRHRRQSSSSKQLQMSQSSRKGWDPSSVLSQHDTAWRSKLSMETDFLRSPHLSNSLHANEERLFSSPAANSWSGTPDMASRPSSSWGSPTVASPRSGTSWNSPAPNSMPSPDMSSSISLSNQVNSAVSVDNTWACSGVNPSLQNADSWSSCGVQSASTNVNTWSPNKMPSSNLGLDSWSSNGKDSRNSGEQLWQSQRSSPFKSHSVFPMHDATQYVPDNMDGHLSSVRDLLSQDTHHAGETMSLGSLITDDLGSVSSSIAQNQLQVSSNSWYQTQANSQFSSTVTASSTQSYDCSSELPLSFGDAPWPTYPTTNAPTSESWPSKLCQQNSAPTFNQTATSISSLQSPAASVGNSWGPSGGGGVSNKTSGPENSGWEPNKDAPYMSSSAWPAHTSSSVHSGNINQSLMVSSAVTDPMCNASSIANEELISKAYTQVEAALFNAELGFKETSRTTSDLIADLNCPSSFSCPSGDTVQSYKTGENLPKNKDDSALFLGDACIAPNPSSPHIPGIGFPSSQVVNNEMPLQSRSGNDPTWNPLIAAAADSGIRNFPRDVPSTATKESSQSGTVSAKQDRNAVFTSDTAANVAPFDFTSVLGNSKILNNILSAPPKTAKFTDVPSAGPSETAFERPANASVSANSSETGMSLPAGASSNAFLSTNPVKSISPPPIPLLTHLWPEKSKGSGESLSSKTVPSEASTFSVNPEISQTHASAAQCSTSKPKLSFSFRSAKDTLPRLPPPISDLEASLEVFSKVDSGVKDEKGASPGNPNRIEGLLEKRSASPMSPGNSAKVLKLEEAVETEQSDGNRQTRGLDHPSVSSDPNACMTEPSKKPTEVMVSDVGKMTNKGLLPSGHENQEACSSATAVTCVSISSVSAVSPKDDTVGGIPELKPGIKTDSDKLKLPSSSSAAADHEPTDETSKHYDESEPEGDSTSALFETLMQLQIRDDEDADLVLQVISSLTEVYLKYKLHFMPSSKFQSLLECMREGKEKETNFVLRYLECKTRSEKPCKERSEVVNQDKDLQQPDLPPPPPPEPPKCSTPPPPLPSRSDEEKEEGEGTKQNVLPPLPSGEELHCASSASEGNLNAVDSANMGNPFAQQMYLQSLYQTQMANAPMQYWMNPMMHFGPGGAPMGNMNMPAAQHCNMALAPVTVANVMPSQTPAARQQVGQSLPPPPLPPPVAAASSQPPQPTAAPQGPLPPPPMIPPQIPMG